MRADRLSWLADVPWLHRHRARAWCAVLLVVSTLWAGLVLATARHGIDRNGHPVGTDFVSFWVAGRTAMLEGATAVYNPARHAAAEHAALPALPAATSYGFFYPPTFLLLCLPLGLLPYLPALALWLGTSFAGLALGLRRLLPQGWAILPIAGDPAMLLNALHGQNAFLSAAAVAWGTVLLDTRPWAAGAVFGMLAFKPHLAIALPLGLLAARQLRAAAAAAGSAAAFCLLAWAVLGTRSWAGFHDVSAVAGEVLVRGAVEPWKMVSAFAAIRVLGGSAGLAGMAQAAQAIAALAALAALAARRPGGRMLGAAMTTTSLLCTPFLLDYDLVLLAIPLAIVAGDAQVTGWWRWEKSVCLLAFTVPFFARGLADVAHLPLAPVAIWLLDAVVIRRGYAERRSQSPMRSAASCMSASGPQ